MHNKIQLLLLIISISLFIVACGNSLPPTEWTRCTSPEKTLTVDCPVDATVLEDTKSRDIIQFNAPKVVLPQGKIEGWLGPITNISYVSKTSSKVGGYSIPDNIDRSDLVAVVAAIRDYDFQLAADAKEETKEIEPPQLKSFNGYPGAFVVYSRTDPDHRTLGRVEQIFYKAVIEHEDKIIVVHLQAREEDGGKLLPLYAEEVLDSIELHF